MLDVNDVVINQGGFLKKQGIRRLHCQGLSHSYSKHLRMKRLIGIDSDKHLRSYNKQREETGPSHANKPNPFLPLVAQSVSPKASRARPRPDDGDKNEEPPSSKRPRKPDDENSPKEPLSTEILGLSVALLFSLWSFSFMFDFFALYRSPR